MQTPTTLVWVCQLKMKRQTRTSGNRSEKSVSFFLQKQPAFGLLQFVTLKVLFVDLFVQLGDLGSDFTQGYFLLLNEELFYYGVCTFAIHWVPGVVASIHCMSTKRAEYGVTKTLVWAGEKHCLYQNILLGYCMAFQNRAGVGQRVFFYSNPIT